MVRKREAPDASVFEHIQPSRPRDPHPVSWRGITGCLDRSRGEALQRRRDIDTARWRGVGSFVRGATMAERGYVAHQLGADHGRTGALRTRVSVPRDGTWRRCWPSLGAWEDETAHAEGAA